MCRRGGARRRLLTEPPRALPGLLASGRPINDLAHSLLFRAMCAAEQHSVLILRTVPEYPATAVVACRREGVQRAFKTVKNMRLAREDYLESFVVIVSADLTNRKGLSRLVRHISSFDLKN